MAGAGKKTFTAGEVLTASDVNTYLMEQSVMYFGGTIKTDPYRDNKVGNDYPK